MSISSDEPRDIEHSKKNICGRLGLLPSHLDLLIQLKSCSFQWEQRCPSTSGKKDPLTLGAVVSQLLWTLQAPLPRLPPPPSLPEPSQIRVFCHGGH